MLVKSGHINFGQVKSSQGRLNYCGTGQVKQNLDQHFSGPNFFSPKNFFFLIFFFFIQYCFGPTIFLLWISNFDPKTKMHFSMEFDSGVGPTYLSFISFLCCLPCLSCLSCLSSCHSSCSSCLPTTTLLKALGLFFYC